MWKPRAKIRYVINSCCSRPPFASRSGASARLATPWSCRTARELRSSRRLWRSQGKVRPPACVPMAIAHQKLSGKNGCVVECAQCGAQKRLHREGWGPHNTQKPFVHNHVPTEPLQSCFSASRRAWSSIRARSLASLSASASASARRRDFRFCTLSESNAASHSVEQRRIACLSGDA